MSIKKVVIPAKPAKPAQLVDIFFCDHCKRRIGKKYYSCYYCDKHFHPTCLYHHVFLYSTEGYSSVVCAGSGSYDIPHYGSVCDVCYKKRTQQR